MSARAAHLRSVPAETPPPEEGRSPGGHEDLGVVALVLVISLVPLASALAGIGRWDGGTLGLATLGMLFAVSVLVTRGLASRRPRRRS